MKKERNSQTARARPHQSPAVRQSKAQPQTLEEVAATLLPEQVAAIVDQWVVTQFCDDQSIGDLICVLKAIVYRNEEADRERVLAAIENLLMPYSPAASQALDNVVARRLNVVREWRVGR